MDIPALPQNIDPRIAEILRQKAALGVTISTVTPPRPAQGAVPGQPAVVEPISDDQLAAILDGLLPRLDKLIRQAISNIQSDGRMTLPEVLALVPEIRNLVSLVVGDLLPQIKGRDAYNLAVLIIPVMVQHYVTPRLPMWARAWMTPAAIRAALNGLQWAYDSWVKPRLRGNP